MDTLPFPASGGFGVGFFILCVESKCFFLLWNNINFVNGIYTGHYSIGATAGFSAAVLGAIMANASPNWYIPAVFVALAAAVLVGLLNAFITVRIGVPAFVGTMAIRSLLSGAISFLTNNTIFYSNNWGETYKLLGQGKIRNVIPYCCLIFLVICVACYIFLEHTKTGRYIYATGANRSAAKNVGIPVVRMQVLSFAIGALLAGIGGIQKLSDIRSDGNRFAASSPDLLFTWRNV